MIIPMVVEKEDSHERSYDIYSRMLKDRVIFLGTEVTDMSANSIVAQMLYLDHEDSGKDIHLYIQSPGGSVTAGLAILDTMNYISADVSTICVGQACSMGALLLAGGAKGKRFVLPNARVMIHQPLGGYQGQASDIEIHTKEIIKIKNSINEMLSEFTGKDLQTIARDTDRDYFFDATEAVEYGLADKVINKKG